VAYRQHTKIIKENMKKTQPINKAIFYKSASYKEQLSNSIFTNSIRQLFQLLL